MAKVRCRKMETKDRNEKGELVPAVKVQCQECGHSEISFGRSKRSVKRSLALLNEECPRNENNFYECPSL